MGSDKGNVIFNAFKEAPSVIGFVVAGKANTPPFAPSSTNNQGFIALFNNFGIPSWIYHVSSDFSGKSSECYDVTQSGRTEDDLNFSGDTTPVIFGVCKVWNQEYKEYQAVIVALNSVSGSVRYARFLPRNLAARYHNVEDDFGSSYIPEFVSEIYLSTPGDLLIGFNLIDDNSGSIAYQPALLDFNVVTG